MNKIIVWGSLNPQKKCQDRVRILSGGGICQTVRATDYKDPPKVVIEPCIAAMRGRNPDNPTSREPGLPTQQMLEIKDDGTSNTLTTVQKDNLLVEPHFRIRKLTAKECWRLMDFSDEDFEKAKAALNKTFYNGADRSNSQLYKMAGNSEVVAVPEAIFQMMI